MISTVWHKQVMTWVCVCVCVHSSVPPGPNCGTQTEWCCHCYQLTCLISWEPLHHLWHTHTQKRHPSLRTSLLLCVTVIHYMLYLCSVCVSGHTGEHLHSHFGWNMVNRTSHILKKKRKMCKNSFFLHLLHFLMLINTIWCSMYYTYIVMCNGSNLCCRIVQRKF